MREFDRDKVLAKAMNLFWNRGFAATSLSDLEQVMGLGRQSIYNSFGDKQALYVAALEYYARLHIERPLTLLQGPKASLSALRRYLKLQIDFYTRPRRRCGCMVGNTAVELAPHIPAIAERVRGYLATMEEAAQNAILNAIAKGEIRSKQPARVLARHIVSTVVSLGVCAKAGLPRPALEELTRVALVALK
jgi:TetR/AcrR family transcriptional repressor of nem operon